MRKQLQMEHEASILNLEERIANQELENEKQELMLEMRGELIAKLKEINELQKAQSSKKLQEVYNEWHRQEGLWEQQITKWEHQEREEYTAKNQLLNELSSKTKELEHYKSCC